MSSKPEHHKGRLFWALLGIVLTAFNLRTAVTSIPPLFDELKDYFHISASIAGLIGMLPTAAFAVFGVLTAKLIKKVSLEKTALTAMCLAALGLILRSFSTSTVMLILTSMIALAGMGIGNVVLPPLVKRYFADRIGVVSSLYITVLQIGTLMPAFLAVPLMHQYGWRVSLGSWSLVAIMAILPWIMLLMMRPPVTHEVMNQHATHWNGVIWKEPLAWAMTAMFGMTSLISYAMFTWIPSWFIDAGMNAEDAGNQLGIYSSWGVLSTFLVPVLAAKMKRPYWIVVFALVCYLIGFIGMLKMPMASPFVWMTTLGLAGATFPLGLTLINLRTRTSAGSAALSSFMQGVGYAAACAGPLLFGVLHDLTHGWLAPVVFLSLCIAIMATGAWYACKPQYLED